MALSIEQIYQIKPIAEALGVELAALAAIVEVESAGQIFTPSGDLPIIRWEGHYFYRLTSGAARTRAIQAGLAAAKAGEIRNPASQSSRYNMLARANAIASEAAYSSISIGVGQVMGSNWKSLGYSSARAMFDRACEGLHGQVELMARFIVENGLVDELQRKDWTAFARAYNGPAYAKNRYDTKMATAYGKARGRLGDERTDTSKGTSDMLRMGWKGAQVRELQRLLVRAGQNINVDGDFGPATKRAVEAVQRENGLRVDGIVGPETNTALQQYRSAPEESLTEQPLLEIPETAPAAVGAGTGVAVSVAAEKLTELAEKVGGSPTLDMISSGMTVLSAVMVVGGVIWGIYGFLKSRKTYRGLA